MVRTTRSDLLFALAIVAAGVTLAAETPSILPFAHDENGLVYFETVHDVPEATGDDLFTRAEEWVTESFSQPQIAARLADSKRGWITFVTLVPTPQGWHGLDTSGDGHLRYEIQLAFKDGRARFRATDFHFLIDRRFGGDGKMRVDVGNDAMFYKTGKKPDKARAELVATLTALSDSFGKALASAGGPDF